MNQRERELKEFIYFVTHNKNLTKAQQLKRDGLLARDYYLGTANKTSESQKNDGITQQANDIDNKKLSIPNRRKTHRSGISDKIEYCPPRNLQHFLREFNQDEILKYTCHLIDSDEAIKTICDECKTESYIFREHTKLIKRHFNNLTQKFRNEGNRLNPNMVTLISVYLTGNGLPKKGEKQDKEKKQDKWSGNNVKENWNCGEILQWADNNPGIIPNPGKNIAKKQKNSGFILPSSFISQITGNRVRSFSDLSIFFKSHFHIRQDNSLQSILEEVNNMWEKENINISFSSERFNNSIEIFTDVDKLIQAYKNIIKLCEECRSNDVEPIQVELEFYDDAKSERTLFTIHHINSVYKKTSKNSIERIGKSQSELISNQINGLCDLFVEAQFGDGICGVVNLWDKNNNLEFHEAAKVISGVKYILSF